MSVEKHRIGIYVELDCLLDVRLAMLAEISEEFALEVASDKRYYTREEDVFSTKAHGKLDKKVFYELLKVKQTPRLYSLATRTRMFGFIKSLAMNYEQQGIGSPLITEINIDVNTYPLILDEEEKEQILKAVALLTDQAFRVNLISKSDEELDYKKALEDYKAMIFYEYAPWCNLHVEAMKKKPMLHTVLYAPRICFVAPPDKALMDELKKDKMSYFEFSSKGLAPVMNIQFLPTAVYSAALPHNLDKYLELG